MRKFNAAFDYIYYTLSKFYYKWDNEGNVTAVLGVTMLQTLLASNLIFIVIKIFFTKEEIQGFNWLKVIGICLFIALEIYNHIKYKGKYSVLKDRWRNESKKQKFWRRLIVILALITPWVSLILIINT